MIQKINTWPEQAEWILWWNDCFDTTRRLQVINYALIVCYYYTEIILIYNDIEDDNQVEYGWIDQNR